MVTNVTMSSKRAWPAGEWPIGCHENARRSSKVISGSCSGVVTLKLPPLLYPAAASRPGHSCALGGAPRPYGWLLAAGAGLTWAHRASRSRRRSTGRGRKDAVTEYAM